MIEHDKLPRGSKLALNYTWNSRLATIALFGLLSVISFYFPFKIYSDQTLFSIDGSFQTYTAVRSLAGGEGLGLEFQSYLGVLMPLSLVPLYLLFGQTLFSATASAAIMCYVALLLKIMILCRLCDTKNWRTVALLTALIVSIIFIFTPLFKSFMIPGVSLRSLRAACPFLMATLAWGLFYRTDLLLSCKKAIFREAILLGAIGGVGFLWSTDAGPPSTCALIPTPLASDSRWGFPDAAMM